MGGRGEGGVGWERAGERAKGERRREGMRHKKNMEKGPYTKRIGTGNCL